MTLEEFLSTIPLDWQLRRTLICAVYARMHLHWRMHSGDPKDEPAPPEGAESFQDDIRRMTAVVMIAIINTYQVGWDYVRYADRLSKNQDLGTKKQEKALRKQFKPLSVDVSHPSTFVDAHGRVVGALYPEVLTEARQRHLQRSITLLAEKALKVGSDDSTSWRTLEHNYLPDEFCGCVGRGAADFSPARFALLHDGPSDKLKPTLLYKTPAVTSWVNEVAEDAAVLSAFLALVQPGLFLAGLQCFASLSKNPDVAGYIQKWGFIYNAATVISNRSTPFHRDGRSSRLCWMDLLCSLGGSDDTTLELRSLGVRCSWKSGSVGLFSGSAELHGVSTSQVDRSCIALYMLDNVHHRQSILSPPLSHIDSFFA